MFAVPQGICWLRLLLLELLLHLLLPPLLLLLPSSLPKAVLKTRAAAEAVDAAAVPTAAGKASKCHVMMRNSEQEVSTLLRTSPLRRSAKKKDVLIKCIS